jgi:hypothetical protein
MINVDAIPSATSPTIETLSSISELVDEQMSEENLSSDDDKQPEEHKQTNVGETYDYLPCVQGVTISHKPQVSFFIYVYFYMWSFHYERIKMPKRGGVNWTFLKIIARIKSY